MKNIAVLVSGGGTNFQSLIDNVENGFINGKICVLISNRANAYALQRAEKHHIASRVIDEKDFENDEAFNEKILETLIEFETDIIALCGYLKIISEKIVKRFEKKIVNVHPSLIPKFCGMGFYGMKVHQAVIDANEKESGATVHFVDENADTGEIILQGKCAVDEGMTAEQLQQRVLVLEHKLMPIAVKTLCEREDIL